MFDIYNGLAKFKVFLLQNPGNDNDALFHLWLNWFDDYAMTTVMTSSF